MSCLMYTSASNWGWDLGSARMALGLLLKAIPVTGLHGSNRAKCCSSLRMRSSNQYCGRLRRGSQRRRQLMVRTPMVERNWSYLRLLKLPTFFHPHPGTSKSAQEHGIKMCLLFHNMHFLRTFWRPILHKIPIVFLIFSFFPKIFSYTFIHVLQTILMLCVALFPQFNATVIVKQR